MKSAVLLSNNSFDIFGIEPHFPDDYELISLCPENHNAEFIQYLAKDYDLLLLKKGCLPSKDIPSFVQLAVEQNLRVIYFCDNCDQVKLVPWLLSVGGHCISIIMQDHLTQQLPLVVKALESGIVCHPGLSPQNSYLHILDDLFKTFDEYLHKKESLTPKEREIIDLYLQGSNLVDIMSQLTISRSTLNTHLESIRNKFEVVNNKEITIRYQVIKLFANMDTN
ncbi:MAG: LuxR C-terminal-related transcriptional regulator [Cyanobacteria bacterium J06621_8]